MAGFKRKRDKRGRFKRTKSRRVEEMFTYVFANVSLIRKQKVLNRILSLSAFFDKFKTFTVEQEAYLKVFVNEIKRLKGEGVENGKSI